VAVKTVLLLFNLIGFLKYQYGYMDRDTIKESCVHFKVHVQVKINQIVKKISKFIHLLACHVTTNRLQRTVNMRTSLSIIEILT